MLHDVPQSDPAFAAKLQHPAHPLNASPSGRDMPGWPPSSAPKTISVAAQTITVAVVLVPPAQLPAARLSLRPSDYVPDRSAPGVRTDRLTSWPHTGAAGYVSPLAPPAVNARPK